MRYPPYFLAGGLLFSGAVALGVGTGRKEGGRERWVLAWPLLMSTG